MKDKNRKHIVVYWFFMAVLFVFLLFSQQIVASIMQGSLSTSKYGFEATFEILWAGLVLLVVLFFKNKYIFTQKKLGFRESFLYIMPEVILSCFFLLVGISGIYENGTPVDIFAIINLALYCLFVGIVEEFLCRGWLLNEFLERYSKNKKEILLSIFFSSVIFGIVHFINIGETQNFAETLVQVMNATAGGIFLSFVYYQTKNIWVVVFSHALWDFSLFLGDANSLGDCLAGVPTQFGVVVDVIRGLVLIFSYLLFSYWLYRQTDLYPEEIKNRKDSLIWTGIGLYLFALLILSVPEQGGVCPNYSYQSLEKDYQVTYYHQDVYHLQDAPLSLQLEDNGRVLLKSTVGEEYVYLTNKGEDCYQYLFVENDNYFTILIQTRYNSFYYGTYQKKSHYDLEALQKIRDSLVLEVVPEISSFGVLKIQGDHYSYPMIETSLGKILYFDKKGRLYMNP